MASTASTTRLTPIAREGSSWLVTTMPTIAPQAPTSAATGTAISNASGQMLVGHAYS